MFDGRRARTAARGARVSIRRAARASRGSRAAVHGSAPSPSTSARRSRRSPSGRAHVMRGEAGQRPTRGRRTARRRGADRGGRRPTRHTRPETRPRRPRRARPTRHRTTRRRARWRVRDLCGRGDRGTPRRCSRSRSRRREPLAVQGSVSRGTRGVRAREEARLAANALVAGSRIAGGVSRAEDERRVGGDLQPGPRIVATRGVRSSLPDGVPVSKRLVTGSGRWTAPTTSVRPAARGLIDALAACRRAPRSGRPRRPELTLLATARRHAGRAAMRWTSSPSRPAGLDDTAGYDRGVPVLPACDRPSSATGAEPRPSAFVLSRNGGRSRPSTTSSAVAPPAQLSRAQRCSGISDIRSISEILDRSRFIEMLRGLWQKFHSKRRRG